MLQLDKILVAIDFSLCSDHALHYAFGLAQSTGAELHVFHVELIHDETEPTSGASDPHPDGAMQQSPAKGSEGLRVHYAFRHDREVAPAILGYADEHGIDVIVLGTHGLRGFRRLLLGSVANEVIRTASCPVFAVHEGEPTVQVTGAIAHLLVPVDFSDASFEALCHAVELAARYGARLDVLHVIEKGTELPSFYDANASAGGIPDAEMEAVARQRLDALYAKAAHAHSTACAAVPDVRLEIRFGYAACEITDYAKEHDCGLIVIASHGLTGLTRFFVGSVTDKVVRSALCPTFVTKVFGKTLLRQPQAANVEGAS